jgi:hypothetical protein
LKTASFQAIFVNFEKYLSTFEMASIVLFGLETSFSQTQARKHLLNRVVPLMQPMDVLAVNTLRSAMPHKKPAL